MALNDIASEEYYEGFKAALDLLEESISKNGIHIDPAPEGRRYRLVVTQGDGGSYSLSVDDVPDLGTALLEMHRKQCEYDEIMKLNNPVVKKRLLEAFEGIDTPTAKQRLLNWFEEIGTENGD